MRRKNGLSVVGFQLPVLAAAAVTLSAAWGARAADRPFCELYATGHFGNWYEVAGEREQREMMIQAKAWGFTRYGDWFDTLDCVNPFSGERQYSLGNALWDRKRINFRTAQSLGLETDLVITPNHVYRDQLKPEWIAKAGPRIQGQLICPSVPAARAAIVENNRQLLADLAAAGVRLNAINLAPYDYGGCACERCKPWILTFAKLSVDIHEIARRYHPGVELHFIGWWWTAEEHRQFAEWMDQNAPGAAASISLHIPYGKLGVADVPLPKGCRRYAFVHIGHPDEPSPRDFYGLTGPVIAPRRLERTVARLREQGVTGVVAYSEGIHDDVNKAILADLWGGRHESAAPALEVYAGRYFEADAGQARAWGAWLQAWGRPFEVNAAGAKRALEALPGQRLDWRKRQWELKADLFAAHQAIGTGKAWSTERLASVERFWIVYEQLQRGVYGLGPQRHIFAPQFVGLPWYKGWAENQRAAASRAVDAAQ